MYSRYLYLKSIWIITIRCSSIWRNHELCVSPRMRAAVMFRWWVQSNGRSFFVFPDDRNEEGFSCTEMILQKRDNWTELAFCIFGNSCLCVSHFLDTLRNYDFMFCVLVCVCKSLGCCCACAFANFLCSFYNVIPLAFVGLKRIQESFQGLSSSRIAQFLHLQWHLGALVTGLLAFLLQQ